MDVFTWSLPFVGEKITDMLIAILNVCSKEELEEEEEEDEIPTTPTSSGEEETAERRTMIKNKILAVGRMSRVFALLREEAERVSELKSSASSAKLPYGTLVLGSEGVKEGIANFDDARKVDIENERLPPDLIDADEAGPASPADGARVSSPAFEDMASPGSPASPATPSSPIAGGHRRGHSRTSSLGTTMSSPSNRRRSLESTVSMIREALEGTDAADDKHLEKLANDITSPVSPKSVDSPAQASSSASK
jgi:serine/threonine-protein phosphatase 2B catalytic subunit